MVTQPDRPAGRGHKLIATPVKRAAEARGLRVLTPEKLGPFAGEARALGADAFVVASYGKIVPQALLDAAPVAFNVHPSLLPLYRGATPLQSAIRDGRTETGVTIIAMDAGMDTGDVLLQERTPIGEAETYGELHDRLAQRGAELALQAVDRYANGRLTRTPQSDVARELRIGDDEIARTRTRTLRKDDLRLSFAMPPRRVVDAIRALSPQPSARLPLDDGELKVLSAHVAAENELVGDRYPADNGPGALMYRVGDRYLLVLHVRGGHVVIDRVVAPNRGPVEGSAFAQRSFDRVMREGSATRTGGRT